MSEEITLPSYSQSKEHDYTTWIFETNNIVYLLKIWQDKNNYCGVLQKQIEIKLQISHWDAKVPNN